MSIVKASDLAKLQTRPVEKPETAAVGLADNKKMMDFIDRAPDGAARPRRSMRGAKKVISLTIFPSDLESLDEYAKSIGMGRGELINTLILRVLARRPTKQELFGN